MTPEQKAERIVWRLSGADGLSFLQGLVTNDLQPLAGRPGIVWAAFLTPQGKYFADFFVIRRAGDGMGELLIDIAAGLAPATREHLLHYRLRADATLGASTIRVTRGVGSPPPDAMADPRHPALGWRLYEESPAPPAGDDPVDWDALRVAHLIPEYPGELQPDASYILENRFAELHGVDFAKGCYLGQEIVARMHHKGRLRRGLVRLAISGDAEPGTAILLADGRQAGTLGTCADGRALALMRLDRMGGDLTAGAARLVAESAP